MKGKDKKELHNKTVDELQKQIDDLRNDVSQLSIDKTVGKVKNVNEARQKKKDIARLLTIHTKKVREMKETK